MYLRFWAAEGARVRIIGGKKLPSFKKHSYNPRIWYIELENLTSSYSLFINNRTVTQASPQNLGNMQDYGIIIIQQTKVILIMLIDIILFQKN